ncbi:MAG: HYR domain-containing protein [Ferruginibacter sp.]
MKKLHVLFCLISLLTYSTVYANPNPPANDPPVITISGNTSICPGGSTTLTASGGSNYLWSTTGQFTPTDGLNNIALAVGLHKLSSSYNGPAMQVRRSSDNQLQDIGFVGIDLDIAALNSFLNGSQGFCTILYDQSGYGRNVVQPLDARQPLFVENGLNGKPVLNFNTSRYMYDFTTFSTPYTIVSYARQNGPSRQRVISSQFNNWLLGWWGQSNDQAYFDGWVNNPFSPADNNPAIYSATGSGGLSSFYKNGTQLASNASGVAAPNGLQLNGWNGQNELSDCDIMDVIIFSTVLSNTQRSAVETSVSNYYNNNTGLISGPSITVSPTTTTTYTVMGTDANGSTMQTVTVTVNSNPVVSCPADITATAATGNCNAIVNFAATATGNEPINLTYSQNSGTSFHVGTTAVNVTATDVNSCSSSCSFNIIMGDVDPPVINCPANVTVLNTSVATYTYPTATDCLPIVKPADLVYEYTGTVQTFTVPAGVSRITIDAYGAEGTGIGTPAGKGGRAKADLNVTAGQVLNIYVGGSNGYNGGGIGKKGANGGGASDIRVGGTALSNRVIVAGGGGGAGGDWNCFSNANGGGGDAVGSNFTGGAGGSGYNFCGQNGGTNGGASYSGYHGGGGGGGGLLSGGQGAYDNYQNINAQAGSLGQGGNSTSSPYDYCAIGAGGGGYYGGGGAAGYNCGAGQGGGGSSWTGTLDNPFFQAGVRTGNGKIVLSFNHGTIVQTAGLPSGSYFPVGTTTNTFLATDASGNTSTCSFDVTVIDNQPPTVIFPAGNITTQLDPGQCTAVVNYPSPIVEDNICSFADSIAGYTVLGDFNGHKYYLSTNAVTWQQAKTAAAAIGGKLVSVTTAGEMNFLAAFNKRFWIGLTDEVTEGTYIWSSGEPYSYTNWNAGEPNNSGNEDYIEMFGIDGKWNDLPASSTNPYVVEMECGLTATLVSGPASGGTFPLGTTIVTWSATDGGGNTAQNSFTVTVSDNQPPVFTSCSSNELVNIPAGQCTTTVTPVIPTATDCSPLTITSDHPSTTFNEGVTMITWSATDTAGNVSTCTSTVTVHAPGAPVISNCPQSITVNNDQGVCGAVINYTMPTATDDCSSSSSGAASFSYTGSVQKFVVPAGVTILHVSATGAAGGNSYTGNTGGKGARMTGDFAVVPGDTIYLMIGQQGQSGFGIYEGSSGAGGGGTFITRNSPTFTNNLLIAAGGGGGGGEGGSSGASTGTTGRASGNGNAYGAAMGGNGGSGGAGSATAGGGGWLSDGGAGDCPAAGLSPGNGGGGGDSYNYCGGANGGYGGGSGSYYGGGGGGGYSGGGGGDYLDPNYLTGTYGGGAGSYNAGINQVNTAGVGNGNGQVSLSWISQFPAVYISSGLPPGSIFPIGTTVNNFTAIDASGNTATCSMTVTVSDVQPPVITCTHDTTVNVDAGQCTAIVNYLLPTAVDNCGNMNALSGFVPLGQFGAHVYYLSNTSYTWETARTNALSLGGVIACINSAAENQFLTAAIASLNTDPWIGAFQNHSNPNYSEPSGGWEWMDGTPFSTYTNWQPFEPNNAGSEDYIQLYRNLGTWNDAYTYGNLRYILEVPNNIILTRVSGPASGAAFPIGTTAVTWKATDEHGNFSTCTFNVTVNGIPSTPGNISGPTNVCPYINTGDQLVYSIDSVTNATGYQWTVPPTVSIVSGQGTRSITVTIGSGFVANINKVIKVKALSPCSNSGEKLLYLLAQFPSTPAAITASSTDICAAIGNATPIVFKIPKTTAAISYIWTAQNGTTTITHPNGTGVNDTTISVIFSSGFTTSAITVQSVNDCGTGGVRSFTVTRSNPATPSLINGPTNVCANIGGTGVPATYSVAAATGTTFNWIVPAGVTGLTGQGTNSISFTYPAGFTSGSISVTATNGCGTSASRTLAVTKLNPATPSNIDVIQTGFCPARTYSYTLASMPANATTVQWTVPADAIGFTGQGTSSITVSYPSTAVIGNVTAQGINNCGVSTIRSVQVKLPVCPVPTFTKGSSELKQPVNVEGKLKDLSITVMPNPSLEDFNILIKKSTAVPVDMVITDLSGKIIEKRRISDLNTSIRLGNNFSAGTYIAHFVQGEQKKVIRLVKL